MRVEDSVCSLVKFTAHLRAQGALLKRSFALQAVCAEPPRSTACPNVTSMAVAKLGLSFQNFHLAHGAYTQCTVSWVRFFLYCKLKDCLVKLTLESDPLIQLAHLMAAQTVKMTFNATLCFDSCAAT